MSTRKRSWPGRVFLGRDEQGKQQYHWVGRFDTKRERDAAVAKANTERPWEAKPPETTTGDQVADAYLADYAEHAKASSLGTATHALKCFRRKFGSRPFGSITRSEAREWARTVPVSYRPRLVTLGNFAVDELELIERNPFRGLATYKSRGRADRQLPDLEAVLHATATLGDYAAQMRALILTGALTGMRPGELYALRWSDLELDRCRVTVSRRIYHGQLDTPKNGRTKVIALPPRARDALFELAADRMALDPHAADADALVFRSKQGRPLSTQTVSLYWLRVRAAAGLDESVDFYLATKHLGVNLLWKQGVSTRAIAAQMGWSERAVDQLLQVYGHKDVAALEEIDALYADDRDAGGTHEAQNRLGQRD
jgi:integrase